MNPFITLTLDSESKIRVNINHISSYGRIQEQTLIKLGSDGLWVLETVEEIDHKIQDTLNQNKQETQESKNEAIDLVKTLRSKLNLTQRQLGYLLGVGRLTVSRWETGHRIISEERQDQMREMLIKHESRYNSFDTLDIYNQINKKNKETK